MYLLLFSSMWPKPWGTKGQKVHLAHKHRGISGQQWRSGGRSGAHDPERIQWGVSPWLRARSRVQDLNEEWERALKAPLSDQLSSTMSSLSQEVSTDLKILPQARDWKLQTWTYFGVFQIQTVTIFQQDDLQRSDTRNWQESKTRAYGWISRFQS